MDIIFILSSTFSSISIFSFSFHFLMLFSAFPLLDIFTNDISQNNNKSKEISSKSLNRNFPLNDIVICLKHVCEFLVLSEDPLSLNSVVVAIIYSISVRQPVVLL